MKQVIYADVLVGVNLFINYFILLGTAKCLYIRYKRWRIFWASLLGSFYSLYIFLPKMNLMISLLVKMVMVITIICIAFGDESRYMRIKSGIYFYGMNIIFCGLMFAIWLIFAPMGLIINNSVVYFNISPLILLISTVISYVIIELVNRILGRKQIESTICKVRIDISGNNTIIDGKIDTGNNLREPFSNLPVIIVKEEKLNGIIPQEMTDFLNKYKDNNNCKVHDAWKKRIRMVPFKTVSGEGILPAFRPDKLEIETSNMRTNKDAYIALCKERTFEEEFSALVSSDLID